MMLFFLFLILDLKLIFKLDLFKGKVFFCIGGRSGICY